LESFSGDQVWNLALQTNGDLVACGGAWTTTGEDFFLVDYSPSGSLETGFGNAGEVVGPFGGHVVCDLYGMATDASGNIVAGGICGSSMSYWYAALARFTATGAPDTTFGYGGYTSNTFGTGCSNFWCMAIQSNGSIVGAGLAGDGNVTEILVARYLP